MPSNSPHPPPERFPMSAAAVYKYGAAFKAFASLAAVIGVTYLLRIPMIWANGTLTASSAYVLAILFFFLGIGGVICWLGARSQNVRLVSRWLLNLIIGWVLLIGILLLNLINAVPLQPLVATHGAMAWVAIYGASEAWKAIRAGYMAKNTAVVSPEVLEAIEAARENIATAEEKE